MVILMPKKAASKDGRKNRYIPLAKGEFDSAAKSLEVLLGYFTAICDDMAQQGLSELQIDGRRTLEESLAGLLAVARKAQGNLQAVKMTLR